MSADAAASVAKGEPEIRWGIVGCGDVTEVKSGPAFQKASGSRLVAVMRRNGALAADYARRHGVPRWYDDADRLIADSEVDAVYVATPPGSHAELALKVAAARKPLYLEKPMARSGAECDRIVEAFSRARVPLFVAYYRRALPRFLTFKRLISCGDIGAVTGVTTQFTAPTHRLPATWRSDAAVAGGGHFLDMASHTLDFLDDLVGPLAAIGGTASNLASAYRVEDVVAMSFLTAGGAPGVGLWNFAAELHSDFLRVLGTEGEIEISMFDESPVRLQTVKGVRLLEHEKVPHIQQPMIQAIVDELLGRGKSPASAASACRTSHAMDQVLASYYGGRGDSFWERPDTWPGKRNPAR